jgi:hypothetical protein
MMDFYRIPEKPAIILLLDAMAPGRTLHNARDINFHNACSLYFLSTNIQ